MPVERASGGTSLIDVLDRVLDKGIVIDAWVRVSLVGIDLITVEARVVVASIDTYLKYSEAVGSVAAGVQAAPRLPEARDGRERGARAPSSRRRNATAPGAAEPARRPRPRPRPPRPWPRARTRTARPRLGRSRSAERIAGWSSSKRCSWPRTPRSARSGPWPGSATRRRSPRRLPGDPVGESPRLVPLASVGVPPTRLRGFSVDLEARDHPLTQALFSDARRSCFASERSRAVAPRWARRPSQAIPLRALEPNAPPAGLLLLRRCHPPAPPTPVAGRACSAPAWPRSPRPPICRSGQQLRHERTLLYSIINAVTDPILLTDAEGRILIANARRRGAVRHRRGRERGAAPRGGAEQHAVLGRRCRATRWKEPGRRGASCCWSNPVDGSDLLFELLSTVDAAIAREGTGVVSVLRNVTDLRRATEEIEENYRRLRVAEAEARAERDRLNLIIDSVADPILVTDPGGQHRLMNAPGRAAVHRPAGRAATRGRAPRCRPTTRTSRRSSPTCLRRPARGAGAASIGLIDPQTGDRDAGRGDRRQGPLRARRGHGGRHHPPRPHRGDGEGAPLRAGEAAPPTSCEEQGAGGHRRARRAERAAAPPGHRARAGLGAEVAVPGQHVARVPHAAQRHPRLHAACCCRACRAS